MKSLECRLGQTPIFVPRLSFGTVFMGSRFDDLPPQAGADLLIHAFYQGVSCWDTSEDYGTHEHIACALKAIPREQVIVSTKMNLPLHPIQPLLDELNTSYIDILLVHDVTIDWLPAAREALITWQKDLVVGSLRAVGISTHSALVAEIAASWQETGVMMLPINLTGDCLPGQPVDGGMDRMKLAAQNAHQAGKGIIAMKVLGFGALASQPRAAIEHVACLPYVDSLVIGMRSPAEIDGNVNIIGHTSGN